MADFFFLILQIKNYLLKEKKCSLKTIILLMQYYKHSKLHLQSSKLCYSYPISNESIPDILWMIITSVYIAIKSHGHDSSHFPSVLCQRAVPVTFSTTMAILCLYCNFHTCAVKIMTTFFPRAWEDITMNDVPWA